MITFEEAIELRHGQTLYHVKNRNADGTPQRWRVNGKVKTWKTRPGLYSIPLKHGLYAFDHLDPNCADLLCIKEAEAMGPLGQSPKPKMRGP